MALIAKVFFIGLFTAVQSSELFVETATQKFESELNWRVNTLWNKISTSLYVNKRSVNTLFSSQMAFIADPSKSLPIYYRLDRLLL